MYLEVKELDRKTVQYNLKPIPLQYNLKPILYEL